MVRSRLDCTTVHVLHVLLYKMPRSAGFRILHQDIRLYAYRHIHIRVSRPAPLYPFSISTQSARCSVCEEYQYVKWLRCLVAFSEGCKAAGEVRSSWSILLVLGSTREMECFLVNAHHPSSPGLRPGAFRCMYTDTRMNMMINKETRVICQGFTGKQVI